MKRGLYLSFILLFTISLIPSVFSLASIGAEFNLTSETMREGSDQAIHCLVFQTMGEQIQCRLVAKNLIQIQSVFCAETVEKKWCQQLITDAQSCFEFNGTEKDACFITKAQSYSVIEYSESDSYVLFLLLDLVQSVEDAYAQDKLTIRESSFLIEKLINMAQVKTRHEPAFLISVLYSEYRSYWDLYTYERVY